MLDMNRNKPFKRAPFRRRIKVNMPVPRAAVQLVIARAQGHCERCGVFLRGERGYNWSIHHRLDRSLGGNNAASNLLAVCGSGTTKCHGWIGSYRTAAEAEGTRVPSWANPTLVPLRTLGRVRRLLDDGTELDVAA